MDILMMRAAKPYPLDTIKKELEQLNIKSANYVPHALALEFFPQ